MNKHKISTKDAIKYSREGLDGTYYQFPEINNGTTVSYAEFTGEHGERTIGERSRIYYILEGNGEFMVNDEKFDIEQGDTIAIPSNGKYNLWPKSPVLKVLLFMELLDINKLPKK